MIIKSVNVLWSVDLVISYCLVICPIHGNTHGCRHPHLYGFRATGDKNDVTRSLLDSIHPRLGLVIGPMATLVATTADSDCRHTSICNALELLNFIM